DPLGLTPQPNPYTYVANPHTFADPLGLAAHDLRIFGSRFSGRHNQAATSLRPSFWRRLFRRPHHIEEGHGFSGVYDPVTRQLEARLSSGPRALVDRFGGHGQINRDLFDGSREAVGFVAIIRRNGIEMRWNSASVNMANFGDRAAPQQLRPEIVQAIQDLTGRTVL
ncbi:hypothetical protein, partial [Streptomyces hainanensis]|uniref:hypothetical protein n=1 Tax=Streptomyces hainanensis TaxID=402648 RepID=UPI001404F758